VLDARVVQLLGDAGGADDVDGAFVVQVLQVGGGQVSGAKDLVQGATEAHNGAFFLILLPKKNNFTEKSFFSNEKSRIKYVLNLIHI